MFAFHTPLPVFPPTRNERPVVEDLRRRAREAAHAREARIDDVVEQSFPASDPPSWNMGIADPDSWR